MANTLGVIANFLEQKTHKIRQKGRKNALKGQNRAKNESGARKKVNAPKLLKTC